MELKSLTVERFRRFGDRTKVNLEGKLVALIGPNEAGKTSLLRAISLHKDDTDYIDADRSRFEEDPPSITLSYFLSSDDVEAAGLKHRTWFHVTKDGIGRRQGELEIQPERDREHRDRCFGTIESLKNYLSSAAPPDDVELKTIDIERIDRLYALLEGGYADEDLHEFSDGASYLRSLVGESEGEVTALYEVLANRLDELVEFEVDHDPGEVASKILLKRQPKILEFTEEYRDLQLPYNIRLFTHQDAKQRKSPSRPLQELLDMAGLDLSELIDADLRGDRAMLNGILDESNQKLASICKGRWSQSDAHLKFDLEKSHLDILVAHNAGFGRRHRFNTFSERSDGYRQFISLQIFSILNAFDNVTLLVDELEQHLHYDAQADMIQMLTNEPSIGKVVYATHSAGCLPEDLGSGVKLVRWREDDKKRSEVINRFWGRGNTDGFAPLLFGLGATTLSFFPTRRALVAEGVTEMLLLPRIFKEALGTEKLGFQVVHGLSNLSPSGIPLVDVGTKRVAYVTDNDPGGEVIRTSLQTLGVSKDKNLRLSRSDHVRTTEDLIDDNVWRKAIEEVGLEHGGRVPDLETKELDSPKAGRAQRLQPFLKGRKVSIAYAILKQVTEDPTTKILADRHKGAMKRLADKVRIALDV